MPPVVIRDRETEAMLTANSMERIQMQLSAAQRSANPVQAQVTEAPVVVDTPPPVVADTLPPAERQGPFIPPECETFTDLGLPDELIESLVFKHLLAVGSNTCRGMSKDLSVPGKQLLGMLTDIKSRQLIVYKGSASMGDFEYTLTEAGHETAQRYVSECAYSGTAPVPLADYVASVAAQSLHLETPGPSELKDAFRDLLINAEMLSQLGPAINSGRGMFLFGFPGNGKTSIAERVTRCFGLPIWIPYALFVEGEIIQLYDPQTHDAIADASSPIKEQAHDTRWIKITRPTIVVGGELTMDSLELQHNPHTKITEAPLQLKSNCGTLVIDDFGRQRMNPDELLNRWIVPLEKSYDFLTLANGQKIRVPFEQLIIFSTNLEPRELVDDAFLRRIPYKINIIDPTEAEFRELMQIMATSLGLDYNEDAVDHLIDVHYRPNNRPFRCCHPRDLLQQIVNESKYRSRPAEMTNQGFDNACRTYFAIM